VDGHQQYLGMLRKRFIYQLLRKRGWRCISGVHLFGINLAHGADGLFARLLGKDSCGACNERYEANCSE
jgi:hypothetical protein